MLSCGAPCPGDPVPIFQWYITDDGHYNIPLVEPLSRVPDLGYVRGAFDPQPDRVESEGHPIALALRRQDDVDDARVTKNETLVRRGKKWFRYDAPDKLLFKQLQKTLPASPD